jgi:hypothetical protein
MAGLCGALIGCAKPMTTFEGSPKVEHGRAGCEKKCAGQGLQFTGMVFVGEYSDACVCQVPGASAPSSGGEEPAPAPAPAASSGAAGPAVAAVVTAKRVADEQAAQQARQAQQRR